MFDAMLADTAGLVRFSDAAVISVVHNVYSYLSPLQDQGMAVWWIADRDRAMQGGRHR